MGRRAGHDAVVIGGGPAGCAAAVTLARSGRSVALVDDRPPGETFRVGEGAPPGLRQAVDEVFGPGTFVVADHQPSYANRSAWGADELTTTDFMANPFGVGWHLDRVAFDARLLEVAQAAGVEVTGRLEASPLVIDASGRRAVHARRQGARLVTYDRLVAVVAAVSHAPDLDATTTVEAVESGWWYTSAIPGGRRVVAYLTDGDLLPRDVRSRFTSMVRTTRYVAGLVGEAAPTSISVVAAGSAHLERPVEDGWLAVGDAAACFDPLSSQGILTAVLMGGRVTEAPEDYAARYAAINQQYRVEQRATYALERRWPESPFWSRRQRASEGFSAPEGFRTGGRYGNPPVRSPSE